MIVAPPPSCGCRTRTSSMGDHVPCRVQDAAPPAARPPCHQVTDDDDDEEKSTIKMKETSPTHTAAAETLRAATGTHWPSPTHHVTNNHQPLHLSPIYDVTTSIFIYSSCAAPPPRPACHVCATHTHTHTTTSPPGCLLLPLPFYLIQQLCVAWCLRPSGLFGGHPARHRASTSWRSPRRRLGECAARRAQASGRARPCTFAPRAGHQPRRPLQARPREQRRLGDDARPRQAGRQRRGRVSTTATASHAGTATPTRKGLAARGLSPTRRARATEAAPTASGYFVSARAPGRAGRRTTSPSSSAAGRRASSPGASTCRPAAAPSPTCAPTRCSTARCCAPARRCR